MITSGNRGYQALCQFIRNNPDNRYSRVVQALQIYPPTNPAGNGTIGSNSFGTNNVVRNVEVASKFSVPTGV